MSNKSIVDTIKEDDPDFVLPANAPAPWVLRGHAYVLTMKFPKGMLDEQGFIPEAFEGSRRGSVGSVMYVKYDDSPVGPYDELLLIPGKIRLADRDELSITRIFVSSMESVVNGRKNWGIPKEQADFKVTFEGGEEKIEMHQNGVFLGKISFTTGRLSFPIFTGWIPKKYRRLVQLWQKKLYTFSPKMSGLLKPAKLMTCEFNKDLFPDLAQAKPLNCMQIKNFKMSFPVTSSIEPFS